MAHERLECLVGEVEFDLRTNVSNFAHDSRTNFPLVIFRTKTADVTGMFGSIGFAYLKGSKFDCDHKKWRLFADVINDMGYMLDIMSPHMYFGFAFMQCSSSLVKALVGVAGGATRASLVQHQAKNNNMADIQAKDGSQETLTNLIALCFSLLLVPFVADSSHLVWTLYLIFTVIHLFANYKGVKSLKIPIFNLTRFGIAVRRFLRSEGSLSLHVINDLEPVWFFSGCSFENRLNLGMPLKAHVKDLKSLRLLCQIYSGDKYILTIDSKTKGINISFDEESDNMTTLTACFQAFLLIQALDHENVDDNGNLDFRVDSLIKLVPHDGREGERRIELLMQLLRQSKSLAHDMFPSFLKELHTQGWDLSRCLISQGDWKYWLTNKEQE